MLFRSVRDYWTSKFYVAGWQGRIYKINNIGFTCENENNKFGYVIAYDSITLRCMPEEYIKAYLKKGADFRFFHASIQHFSLSNPRDTIEDMKAEWQILEQKYHYKEILEREDSNLYGGNIEDDDDDDDWDEDWDEDDDEDEDWDEDVDDDEHGDDDPFGVVSEGELWIAYEVSLINNKHNFKIGDSVVAKSGVLDHHTDKIDIGGWQGRIRHIEESHIIPGKPFYVYIYIEFDSITLQQMPENYIQYCIKHDYDFRCYEFYVSEIKAAMPRDTKAELIATRLKLDKKYDYASILNLDIDEPEHLLYMDEADCN